MPLIKEKRAGHAPQWHAYRVPNLPVKYQSMLEWKRIMEINRNNPGAFGIAASKKLGLDRSGAKTGLNKPQTRDHEQMIVTTRTPVSSFIPPHSLPEKAIASTPPVLLPSQMPITRVEQETVGLANHVSLQIFSTARTRNDRNVMVFLHGGPGLAYGEDFKPVTDWFIEHGYTVVAPEIAGSGKSGLKNMSNSHTQNYVGDLKSVIHCLRERADMQGKQFCVVAHSWGGFQLASLLTDDTAEERNFFTQGVFISSNLDSAQTRLFADAAQFNDASDGTVRAFESVLVANFEERHAGRGVEMAASEKITVLNNPLIDQSLNEKFSPFYRLDKMPKDIPCLFFHAADDKNVPVSQSVEAFDRINNAGGDARLVISSQGGHGFFKTGKDYHAEVTKNCFGAIDSFVKQAGSSAKAVIDGAFLADKTIAEVEGKILDTHKNYQNYTKVLDDFHQGNEAPETGNESKRIPPKRKLLRKIADARAHLAARLESSNSPVAIAQAALNREMASLINDALEKS
jgi:pimeloyl-ACP methyl ester carboxylesterase